MKHIAIAPTKDQTVSLALDTLSRQKQALVFCNSKRAAESQAEKIAKAVQHGNYQTPRTTKLTEQILNVLSTPTKQCKRLALCTLHGIAFHHAGLASKQRELVEDAFRDGTISVICSTPTLAAGLDLPAFRTIIRDTKRFGMRGMMPIPVLEYEQMAGRAGRPGKEDYGEAILVANKETDVATLFEQYVHGEVEDIFSKLAVEPVLRTYVLSLVATQYVRTTQELYGFFNKTFYAHQFGDRLRLQRTLDTMITRLQEWEFLTQEQDDKQNERATTKEQFFTSAAELLLPNEDKTTNETLHATRLGERVSQLYIDPLSAHILLEGLAELKKRATKTEDELQTFAVIHLLTCTLEMLPLLRSKVMDTSSIEQRRLVQDFLVSEETFYEISVDDFDDTIKTTQCLYDWANELAEDEILEKYNVRPGELSGKLQKTDWLLYACEELARMSEKTAIIKIIKHVRTRLKHGVKAELLPLLAFKHIGRVRARKLFIHNIKTIADVERVSTELLHGIVGEKIAKHLKEQVGQKNNNAAVEKQKYLS